MNDILLTQEDKRCSCCGDTLPRTSFGPDVRNKSGLRSRCHSCERRAKNDWYSRNRDAQLARNQRWAVANPEKVNASRQSWDLRHIDEHRSRTRDWKRAHPEQTRAQRHLAWTKRRCQKGMVVCESVVPERVFERDKWRCQICGCNTHKELRGTIAPNAPELDHIIPLSLGGPHTVKNAQCLCRECNRKKGATYDGQLAFA